MLPLSLLRAATGSPLLVELKDGTTYNGRLGTCDPWMNMNLTDVICTSSSGERFWKLSSCYIRGSAIKYLRLSESSLEKAVEMDHEHQQQQQQQQQYRSNTGRTSGRGRGYRGGDRARNPGPRDGRGRGRGRSDGRGRTEGRGRGRGDGRPSERMGGRGRGRSTT